MHVENVESGFQKGGRIFQKFVHKALCSLGFYN